MDERSIAGFRILRELGRGGMGVVYLARQDYPERDVALKVVSPELADDPAFRDRFIAEANAVGSTVGTLALVLLRSSDPEESVTPPAGSTPSGGTAFQQGLLVIDPETGEEVARYPGSFGTGRVVVADPVSDSLWLLV